MDLPHWLEENNDIQDYQGQNKKSYKLSFIEKTLKGIINFMQTNIFSEEIAFSKGLLQNIDPRIKIVILILLLVIVNLLHHLSLLWIFYALLLIVAAVSNIKIFYLLKRVWLVIPLFTGIMVFPALFNWVRPGDPLLVIWNYGTPIHIGPFNIPAFLAITNQGLWGDILLVSRVGISVTLAVIIILTTRWHELLRALRSLFVPKIFVVTLEMTYRYIFVLLNILEEMFFARKARDAGQSSGKEQRGFIASAMGSMFGKSLQMSEEVYAAMLARGFTGEIHVSKRFQLHLFDVFIMGFVLLSSLILYVSDKVIGV